MKLGASTACFYPLETEKALLKVTELGYKYAEVFMNAPSELEEPFLKQLNTIAKNGEQILCLFIRFQALWKVPVFLPIIKEDLTILFLFTIKPATLVLV